MPPVSSGILPVNEVISPSFVQGYTGPCTLNLTERERARQNFDITDAEKALAVFFADLLDLAIGQEMFYSSIPENIPAFFAVQLLPCDPGKHLDYWQGKAVVKSRSRSRLGLLRQWGRLLNALPLTDWLTVNSNIQQNAVTFCRITPLASAVKAPINASGVNGFSAEMEFSLQICITPPAPEFSA